MDPITEARSTLNKWLSDFPFQTDNDRDNAINLFLRAVTMPAGPSPLFVIEGEGGVGKTLLARVLIIAATGSTPVLRSLPSCGDEMEKVIGALCIDGEKCVVFDNARGNVSSPVLDGALTSPILAVRAIGSAVARDYPTPRLIVITTQGDAKFSGDIERRVVRIRLKRDGAISDARAAYPGTLQWTSRNWVALHAAGQIIADSRRDFDFLSSSAAIADPTKAADTARALHERLAGSPVDARDRAQFFLRDACEKMLSKGMHSYLNDCAYTLGRYVAAGHADVEEVEVCLLSAALAKEGNRRVLELRRTIKDALDAGSRRPVDSACTMEDPESRLESALKCARLNIECAGDDAREALNTYAHIVGRQVESEEDRVYVEGRLTAFGFAAFDSESPEIARAVTVAVARGIAAAAAEKAA